MRRERTRQDSLVGEMLRNRAQEKIQKEYYVNLETNLLEMAAGDDRLKNRISSYFVSLLKGKHKTRELPADIANAELSRSLRMLAYDRTFTENVLILDSSTKKAMDETAEEVNKKREGRGDFSGQIQRLVRLARMHLADR